MDIVVVLKGVPLTSTRQSLTKHLVCLLAVFVAVLSGPTAGYAQNDAGKEQQIAAVQAKLDAAVARVKAIVNQPVNHLTRTPDMNVSVFSPGWFHDGAIKPDFATVDVRATQDLLYSEYPYVTSDMNPGEVFAGSDLEFNAMTKYFYTDRTVPKKRLTEAEMLEINQLYRTIAQSTQQLEQLKGQGGLAFMHLGGVTGAGILALISVIFGGLFLIWPVLRTS